MKTELEVKELDDIGREVNRWIREIRVNQGATEILLKFIYQHKYGSELYKITIRKG